MRRPVRIPLLIALSAAGVCLCLAACGGSKALKGATTSGHRTQLLSILQSDGLMYTNPALAVGTARSLGVQVIRFNVVWANVAPDRNRRMKPKFDATDPGAYPGWGLVDVLDRLTAENGIKLYLTLTSPAPLWATGVNAPKADKCALCSHWEPSASDYGAWVTAAGKRYDGHYTPKGQSTPLPRVSFWSMWNEPNYGPDLAPQATGTKVIIDRSAPQYRKLLDSGWSALAATGHTTKTDTILIGETAPRGEVNPGIDNMTPTLQFVRDLYCVDEDYVPLTGTVATIEGCPANGSKTAFAAGNPALFEASGWSDHPYSDGNPPDVKTGSTTVASNWADFARLSNLMTTLDRAAAAWGTDAKLPIYNTEYGNLTKPPSMNAEAVSLGTAAKYLNWTEYLSWKNPRIASFDQYLLEDPAPHSGSAFFSAIETSTGAPKPILYDAYRLPLFLPTTNMRVGQSLTVWGCVRPALNGLSPSDHVDIQLATRGAHFHTVKEVSLHPARDGCYFDTTAQFASSGSVRLAYRDGTVTIFSRIQTVTIK